MDYEIYILASGPNDEYVGTFSEEAAKEIVYENAQMYNYGMFRYWEIDDVKYYDVGPKTYKLVAKNKNLKIAKH